MAKFKIQKGLSDADMMKNFKDTENFEETMLDMERSAKRPVVHQSPKQKEDAFYREFLTDKVELVKCCSTLRWNTLKKAKEHFLSK